MAIEVGRTRRARREQHRIRRLVRRRAVLPMRRLKRRTELRPVTPPNQLRQVNLQAATNPQAARAQLRWLINKAEEPKEPGATRAALLAARRGTAPNHLVPQGRQAEIPAVWLRLERPLRKMRVRAVLRPDLARQH